MDDDVDDLPDPSSALYKAKIMMWTEKLKKAEDAGKVRRIQYYRKLLFMYPPIPSGHKLLREYLEVLEKEYPREKGKSGDEGLSDAWIAALTDEAFAEAGTTKEIFDEWQNTSERLFKEKEVTIAELKTAWGLNKKPKQFSEPESGGGHTESAPGAAPTDEGAKWGGMYAQQQGLRRGSSAVNMMRNMGALGQHQAMAGAMQQVTTTVQRTIVQPQVMIQQQQVQKMAATVPWGYYGGMQMTVQTSAGPMRVTIPPGYGPGSSFTFNVPVTTRPVMQQPMMYQQQMMMQRF